MNNFKPYVTSDGSIGLYNSDFDDIYHSSEGAVTEALEKFVYPVNYDMLLKNSEIKILDICYGIGYNTKSFINYFLKKNFFFRKKNNKKNFSNTNIAPIYTNNISNKNGGRCSESIYTNNDISKIYIKTVDNDKFLTLISPFIKNNVSIKFNKKLDYINENIKKYLNNAKRIKNNKISKLINFLILEKIINNKPEILCNADVERVLNDKSLNFAIDSQIRAYFNSYKNFNNNLSPDLFPTRFLHNIYYKYITKWYKWRIKHYNLRNFDIVFDNQDARTSIINDKNLYNLIFLDAFTPAKCPCLWSLDFFKELYKRLDNDGMLLTYSSAASVRNAMIEAGFKIGRIYNERLKKYTGTVAVKNSTLIKYPLSDYDLGLLKTKAGIFYRDKDLTSQNEAIIKEREIELKNSDKMSSTSYIKSFLHE